MSTSAEAQRLPEYVGARIDTIQVAPSTEIGSDLVAEISLGAAVAILAVFLETRLTDSDILSLLTAGAGSVGGVSLGAFSMRRRPNTLGMVAGAASAVALGIIAGNALSDDRSDVQTAWFVFAHVLTVPAAAVGSHF